MENRQFVGWRVTQRNAPGTLSIFAFYAPVKDIAKWAGVRRTVDEPEGTQRVVRPSRVKAITRFLSSGMTNIMPNSILVCFQSGAVTYAPLNAQALPAGIDVTNGCDGHLQWGKIDFEFDETAPSYARPALVVDGQHRLLGLSSYQDEDVPMLVVALLEASVQDQAFHFIVINNKAVRVPTDNVKAILAGVNEDELTDRLLRAGVKYGEVSPLLREINDLDSSPFKNLLDWDYNRGGTRLIPVTALEQALRYISVEFPILAEDEDSTMGLLFAVWRGIKAAFPNLWGRDNTFMKKVTINALNEFIVHRIKIAWEFGLIDIFESDQVERQTLNTADMLTEEFWQTPWSIKIQDNANVRSLIVKDLEKMVENHKLRRHWDEDLSLISREGTGE